MHLLLAVGENEMERFAGLDLTGPAANFAVRAPYQCETPLQHLDMRYAL